MPSGTFCLRDKIWTLVLSHEKLQSSCNLLQPTPIFGSLALCIQSRCSSPYSAWATWAKWRFFSSQECHIPSATSTREIVDCNASMEQIELHLHHIRHWEVTLWLERDYVLHRLEKWSSEEISQLCQVVQALHQRFVFLECENWRLLKMDRKPCPVIMAHLESIPSTKALVSYHTSKHTLVYPLGRQDICLLDLPNRTPCLTSDVL